MNKLQSLFLFELKKTMRSKAMVFFALLFTSLLVSITFVQLFALPVSTGFSRASASFLNVTLFIFPLFTLAIGAMSVSSDIESRWYALLSTYPMKTRTYIIAKWLSHVFAFSLVLLIAYSIILIVHSIYGSMTIDSKMIAVALLLVFIFSSIAIAIGSITKTRLQSLTTALGVWAVLLLIVDYIVMALGTLLSGELLKQVTIAFLFINPVQWVRTGYILFSGNGTVFGPAYYNFSTFMVTPAGIALYVLISVLWLIVPLIVAGKFLRKSGDK